MVRQFHFFEDYQVGQGGVTATRTVTEADVTNFAGLICDFSKVHVDRHFMANSIYGERIAHGLLASCLAEGMLSLKAPHIIGRGIPGGYFYSFEANYRAGIKLGDTIKIQWQVTQRIDDSPFDEFGLVKSSFQVVNQEEAVVTDGTFVTLVKKQAAKENKLEFKFGEPVQFTELVPNNEQIYYAEDYSVGMGGETEGRTITETDVGNFASITGDYNPQYVDVVFAKQSMFGERIAPPMLVFSIAFRLWARERDLYYPQPVSTKIAGHLSDSGTFLAPVKIGDTIHCRYRKTAGRVSHSKQGMAIVTYEIQTLNQRNEVVQDGSTIFMIASRTGADTKNLAQG